MLMADTSKNSIIGKSLQLARSNTGLAMVDAAKAIGISQSQLSRMETGDAAITAERLVDLASLYNVAPEHLLTGLVDTTMADPELDRIGDVIEFIEGVLASTTTRPSARKIRDTVLSIYRLEAKSAFENGKPFELHKYQGVVAALIKTD
ncbi:MAG: hypothetical protein COA52_09930 [Hyphomicrobiales bacterium]|nr:MAG: hypothetical protein COA52_09930 [Hyphomicrobiales bacterium]